MPFPDLLAGLPRRQGSVAWAAALWLGCLIGLRWGAAVVGPVLFAAGVIAVLRRPRPGLLVALVAVGSVSGGAAAGRIEAAASVPIVPGSVAAAARVMVDSTASEGGLTTLVRFPPVAGAPEGAVSLVESAEGTAAAAGDAVWVDGGLRDLPGHWRGDPYRATVRGGSIVLLRQADGFLFGAGNALRAAVRDGLGGDLDRPAGALLAGFLVGDTSHMAQTDLDNLRSAGLTHFVAVSGSNVALFLGAWWLVVGPLRLDPRLRAITGLVVLVIFVVATRWEPSVVRASTMAAVVLGGRALGIPVDPWRAIGVAVSALLVVSGELAVDVGFQLSVAATCGVLIGARVPVSWRPKWIWRIVAATVAAQLAVLPIVLLRFGTVPLLSPVANVLATPLVTVATAFGGVSAFVPARPLRDVGLLAAQGVLAIAQHAAGWPQLGTLAAVGVVLSGFGMARRSSRSVAAAGLLVWGLVAIAPTGPPAYPELTFLDVGQGDAILLRTPGGAAVLIDGGRDADVLADGLSRHGVDHLDLLVVTHGDADHVGGLAGITDRVAVAELWYPALQTTGPLLADVLAEAHENAVPVRAVATGEQRRVDGIDLSVLSPGRRFAADNNGSVALWLTGGDTSVLLTGDVEATAQAELPDVRPDILQVPHHGSATTDVAWLRQTVGEVAIISVGKNTYGHPAPSVLEALDSAGVQVWTTQEHGDVTVPLCGSCR